MLRINMFSTADKVKGQGVGSAYVELVRMLKDHFPNDFKITINSYAPADITHYHTINPSFYLSTFSRRRGRKIGYVHFLPETLEGSIKIPQPFKAIFYKYVIAFYKRMDHIVVVNPSFIPKLERYGINKERITYIPNFVSKAEFYDVDDQQKQALRVKHGYDPKRFTILGSGQIQTRKGVLDFVKLAKQNPTIQFIWTGGFSPRVMLIWKKSSRIPQVIYRFQELLTAPRWFNIIIWRIYFSFRPIMNCFRCRFLKRFQLIPR